MNSTQILAFAITACLGILLQPLESRADLILNSVGNTSWNKQGNAPRITLSITADENTTYGENSNRINSFNIVFRIEPRAGAFGNLNVQAVVPTTNSVFATFSDLSLTTDFGNGLAAIQGQNAIVPPQLQPANVSLPPGSRRNLVELEVTPTAGASGEFLIYASSLSNYTFVDEFDGVAFGNFPFSDQPYEALMGSYIIFDAVPEPSSALLGLTGTVLVSTCRRRHRHNRQALSMRS